MNVHKEWGFTNVHKIMKKSEAFKLELFGGS